MILAAVVLTSGCATNPVTGKQDLVLMSEAYEIELGRRYHQEVLKFYRVYDDPELQAYVNRIGERLANDSHRNHLIYHFTVLDSPEVNAFALPGGYIYITRGILAYMNSEAELAGVLGHEIGHVTARHAVRRHTTATITGILGSILAAETGVQGAQDITNILGTAIVRGYGREHELEADRLGAEYLARVGYEPHRMIEVVGILKAQEEYERQAAEEEGREPRTYHGVFATHPDNDRRLQEVVQAADQYRAPTPLPDNREAYLRMSDGMVVGPGEHEGVLRANRFYHKPLDLTLEFPAGWKVENLPERVLARTRAADAVVQLGVEDLNIKQTPEAYLRDKFGEKKLLQGEPIRTADFEGYTGIVKLGTPWGRRPTRVAVFFHNKQAFMLAGAAENADSPAPYDAQFLATIGSFRKLKASEQALAEPRRIKLITAKRGQTFADLARTSPIPYHAEEQLRLINGLYPAGEPTPGQLLKIIQ